MVAKPDLVSSHGIGKGSTVGALSVILLLLAFLFTTGVTMASPQVVSGPCTNQGSPGFRVYLPDCRAYELVTPPYKEAMSVLPMGALSPNGSFLTVETFGSFAGVTSTAYFGAVYGLRRGVAGWQAAPLEAPVVATYPRFEEVASSNDFTRDLWIPKEPDEPGEGVYVGDGGGVFDRIGPGGPPGALEPRLNFAGASGDLSHVVFRDRARISVDTEVHLWPGDATIGEGQQSLYEYVGTGNVEPLLVGISNEGVVAKMAESHLISLCGTELGSLGDVYHAISKDGSKIFLTALGKDANEPCRVLPPEVEPPVSEVFVRVDNGEPGAHTVAISEPSPQDCSLCNTSAKADARFRGASADGSKVFFTTEQQLLAGATGSGPYLYEYDFNSPEGERIALLSGGDSEGSRVQGVARVSDDGSHVYFVAQGVLTGSEENAYGDRAHEGAENLYVATSECAGGGAGCPAQSHLSFIGRLSEDDNQDWAETDSHPVQTTPDGRFLVFQSRADLTPDESERQEAGQVFEFDTQTGALVRVSRGENGYNEDGNSNVYAATIGGVDAFKFAHPESHFTNVSKDGSYVFFSSANSLTPGTLVGHSSVYEYHNGRVSLISDGHDVSASGSTLLGGSETGQDVFFESDDQLVPQDVDTQGDLYDARIGGGLMASVRQLPCSGDSCQGPASTSQQQPSPATSSVTAEADGGEQRATPPPKPHAKPKAKPRKKRRLKRHRVKKSSTRRR